LLPPASVAELNEAATGGMSRQWRRLFSVASDGSSFRHLVSRISGKGPTLLVLRTGDGSVIGGYADSSWSLSRKTGSGHPSFFGGEGCFLFSLQAGSDADGGRHCKIHRVATKDENRLYCHCEKLLSRPVGRVPGQPARDRPGCISFGGQLYEDWGDYFGLAIYDGLVHGSTQPTATYGNPKLAPTAAGANRVISDCHFAVPLNHFIPGFLSK
jgi:hypothetical protein